MLKAASGGFSTATDLADYLVRSGVAFRDAHDIVGRTVNFAIESDKQLDELSLADLQQFHQGIQQDVFEVLTVAGSVAARNHPGGTAPAQVRSAIARARNSLAD
jgi:argininosuccinate lyase